MHTNYPRIANKIIEWGIIFLIVFTPIAFGTVHPWAYTIMELTVCIMVIVWIVRLAMININKTTIFPSHQSPTSQNRQGRYSDHQSTIKSSNDNRHSTINKSSISNHQSAIINQQSILVNRFGFIKTPLTIPIILFVGLILFQLTPLPPGVLKILSPNTYKLYETTIPDWQPSAKNHELSTMSDRHSPSLSSSQSAISHQPSTSKSWQSISVYNHATKTELFKVLAYVGIFFLIVNYNPSTVNRQPKTSKHRSRIKSMLTRLIIVLIIMGSLESIYGLLECLGGFKHSLFMKNVYNSNFVTGTYVNLNHYSGYMAFVICMSFGYLTYLLSKIPITTETMWRQRLVQMINLIGTRAGLISFLILIMSSALILSGSRMGICSFVTAVILISIMISKKVSIKKLLIIVLPICLMSVWIGLNPVIKKFSSASVDIEAEGGRKQIWNDTYNLIKDFPALGTGLGTYEYVFPKYKTIKAQKLFDHAHNDYLELISDMGFTGFLIVIAGAVYYLFIIIKMWFQRKNSFVRGITVGCFGGIAYIIVHSLTDFNLHIPANALHLSIITGIMHKTVTQL
jgi:O-antigen ligase